MESAIENLENLVPFSLIPSFISKEALIFREAIASTSCIHTGRNIVPLLQNLV